MPKYEIEVPGKGKFQVESPTELTDFQAYKAVLGQLESMPTGKAPFSLKDTGIALAQGIVGAGKSLTDVAGAGNVASDYLGSVQKGLGEAYSPKRQAEMARREETQKEASASGSTINEIGAFLGSVAEAPVQSLAQALGSIAPYVATGVVGGIAKLGGATVKAINTVVGAAQGAGAVKGSIYDGVKSELIKSGMSEQEAESKASKAQEYLGDNFLSIAGGSGLGAIGARLGVENLLTPGAAAKLNANLLPRVGKAVLGEAPVEGLQGGQQQLATNLALQKEGFDVDPMQGVAGSAVRDAALGALAAGAIGGVRGPSASAAKAGREAADAAILADQQKQAVPPVPPVTGMAPVTPGTPIATPPATVPTLFEPTELPGQLTPDEVAGQTLAGKPVVTEALPLEQQKISELERNIEALVQQGTPEALAQAETLKQQLPESPQAKVTRLGEEMMTLERKYKELEVQRDATKPLKEKEPLSLQMNAIRERQNEILSEGEVLKSEGVDFEPAEGLFKPEGKRKLRVGEQGDLNLENVVTEDAFKEMGIGKTNKKLREAILGKSLSDPAERDFVIKALDAFASSTNVGKDMSTRVDQYARKLEQEALSEPGTVSDVGAGTGQPSFSMPSGEFRPTPGLEASSVAGLAGAQPDVGGPLAGAGLAGKIGKASVARPELLGKTTIDLADRITQGDLKGALQDIATSKQYSQLDNLVAKRLLQAKSLPKVEVVPAGSIDGSAQYDPNTDTVQIAEGQIDSHTVLHETVHGFLHAMIRTSDARKAKGLGGLPKLKSLEDIYKHVQKTRPDLAEKYGMKDLSEFASEAMSNPDFQNDLRNTPYRRSNVFAEFGRAVLRLMGINLDKSNIADIDSLTAALISAEDAMTVGRKMQEDVQGGVRQQADLDIAPVVRTPQGSQAEADMLAFGGKAEPKEQSFIDRQKDKFNASKNKWQESYELNNDWVSATFGKMQNIASFDQAFNNRLYNHFTNLKKQGVMTMQQVESALIRISASQALHRGNLANQIIDRGNYDYDAVTNRWNSVEDPVNMKAFEGLILSLAKKLGVEPNRARQIMGAAYEANRLQSMYQDLDTATKELAQAEVDLKAIKDPKLKATKKKLIDTLRDDVESLTDKVQHKTPAQVAAGMRLYNSHPEIQEGTKVWNTMRERVVKMLVETGVKTEKQAEAWLDEAAYVPFFRDMEEEKVIGPQVMSRGMRESMKDYGMKGSMRDVNDPIENMYQWMQWSIARAISNKQLQVMLDSYRDALPSEVRDGKGVNGKTFAIYRDGVQKFYNVDDAAVAQAFMGLEPVIFPAIKYFATTSNFLRHAVTRMPLFPVVQIFNDSYNAMFVSGLKNPFGLLKEIAKEVVATTKGTSETRNKLIQAGILETHDYNALNEAEAIGQRLNLNEPGAWAKLARNLDRFSSASDNVIRQGIYNQSRKEGLSHEAAMEKAAEVVNFRRVSGNETMQLLSRIVPFFNAYTQVASVAVKTLTGRGISPQERDVAAKTLIATTTKVMLLSMMYSMAVGDDEDYQKKNRVSRDRMFMIPGSGGFGIPIRLDIFAIPKLTGEYGYQLMTDSMFTDSKMFRESMARAIKGSIMPPSEGVPQLVRPALGVMMNYDAFQDREIINATMRRLDPERQYTKTTSEMAKALGAMSGVSPLNIDFLLRGYLGSVATLTSLATNDAINAVRGGPPRPDQSIGNIISSLPNMGAMMSKEENTAVLTDFYEVARDVNKAVDTLSSMKYASPEAKQAYREEHKKELALKGQVQAINKQLTVLRRREQLVREAPEERMSAELKQAELKRIDELRGRMTQNVMKIRQKLYE
jgi:hypothetical protein